ncbi:GLPGLI family protein [Pedobacter sp. AK013]|uniref:GLPGLI family protein n=1 Tax=Pedobacter sp. AK013 TaxID=2723071 RepID=UPI001615C113|nr:GLPGLI family protein [Pedobacter sp. AK013]MBB6237518.1 GLPGLI family protein [Pedobacter sp. AK013]
MHRYLFFWVTALVLCLLYSFNYKKTGATEPPTGIAYYQFYHIKDTTQLGKVMSEDFMLVFKGDKSVYTSLTRAKQDSTMQAKLKEAEKTNSNGINMGLFLPTTEDDLYINNGTLSVVKNYNDQSYLIEEPLKKTDWSIGTETKQLLGYTCQMATGMVKGRRYTVWFTTDIPASFGPWKLQGLPGIILEAYDDHYYIKFTCTKIVTDGSFQKTASVDLPAKLIPTTKPEYERMKQAYLEGFGIENFGDGVSVDKVAVKGSGAAKTAPKKTSINYPLELIP